VTPGLVRVVMGHESLATTMKYLHPETANIKAVIDRRNLKKMVGATNSNKNEDASTAHKNSHRGPGGGALASR